MLQIKCTGIQNLLHVWNAQQKLHHSLKNIKHAYAKKMDSYLAPQIGDAKNVPMARITIQNKGHAYAVREHSAHLHGNVLNNTNNENISPDFPGIFFI